MLPFGLSTAHRGFTRIVRVIEAFLKVQGVDMLQYLDDWLMKSQSRALVERHRDLTLLQLSIYDKREITSNFLVYFITPNNNEISYPDLTIQNLTQLKVIFIATLVETFCLSCFKLCCISMIDLIQKHNYNIFPSQRSSQKLWTIPSICKTLTNDISSTKNV